MERIEERGIVQELEHQMEEKKLKEIIDIIQKQILDNIDKRKEFSNQLIEYRKKAVEEYKDDEDKIIEYFDHERFIKEEAYKRFDKKILELTKLKTSPYFGSIEFKEEKFAPEEIKIGRFGVMSEDNTEPIVVDWRAPVASLFYKGKTGNVVFEAPNEKISVDILNRKQYVIKKGILEGVFTSELNVTDEILKEVLCRNTSEKLKDIIMSIQEEQDEIIRLPYNKSSIVDGVAGSGKTTIALHRVAYVLYNYREVLQDKILIFGPNMVFMDYISNVLPELGESGVPQDTFHEFMCKALELENVNTYDQFLKNVFNDNKAFIEDYKHKNSKEFIGEIDTYLNNVENAFQMDEDMYFRDRLVVSKEELQEMFTEYFVKMPVIRKTKKIRRIIFNKISSVRNEIYYEIDKRYKDEIASLSDSEKNVRENDILMKRRIEIENLVREIMAVKDSLKYLRGKSTIEYYRDIVGDIELNHQDLAPIMYMDLKLNGARYQKEIKHIIIDEGQDWTKLQLEVIKEYTKCINYTIVGDKNQSLLPLDTERNFGEFIDEFSGMKKFELKKSYRSTKEIMDYANHIVENKDIVPLVRSGQEVEVEKIEDKKQIIDSVKGFFSSEKDNGFETNAVICQSIQEARVIYEALNGEVDCKLIDSEEVYLTKGNIIIPVCYGKGLEFDTVLMITEEGCKEESKYVMATRALHKLKHVQVI